jgi:hypothetical protein
MVIHESTHVWQGIHSAFSWWYVFNSLYNQIKCGDHAYDVDEKNLKTWSTYNVEQQAHLIEDWYSRGSLTTDVCYPFVRDNIRPAKPWAQTALTLATNPLLAGRAGLATSLSGSTANISRPALGTAANSVWRPGSVGAR